MSRKLSTVLALLALATLSIGRSALAQSDQDNTAHTGWNWLKNQTVSQLNSYLSNNNARITDLQAANAHGTRFDAVVVSNTGAYAKSSVWFPKMTLSQAFNYGANNGYRPIAIAPYILTTTSGSSWYFAAVYIANTGADLAGWSLYASADPNVVLNSIYNNGQRPIQFKPFGVTSSGTAAYVGVGLQNDGRGSAALVKASVAQINAQINQGYRLVELMPDANGTFTALLDTHSVGWLWWYNVSSDFLWGTATWYSARPISIAPAGKYWDAVEIQN